MPQVQDCLDFKIDTPEDAELMKRHREDFMHHRRLLMRFKLDMKNRAPANPVSFREGRSFAPKTKNQKKRARKAQRKAKKVTA